MSKVKLTQEQAEAMEIRKDNDCFDASMKLQIEKEWDYMQNKCLNDLTAEEFAKAWIEGYEVEPRFEVGDVVVIDNKLFEVDDNHPEIPKIKTHTHEIRYTGVNDIRHATALEKQLFELGRTEPKVKVGDIVMGKYAGLMEVMPNSIAEKDKEYLKREDIQSIYPIEHRIEVGDNQ